MHEYRRFIQGELDARGWRQSELVRKSGLSRQLISSILRDDRDHLGQMPDASTMEALATGFGVSVDTVRAAAARSLVEYSDDGSALTVTLSDVSTDALLTEIRRRIDHVDASSSATESPASGQAERESKEVKLHAFTSENQGSADDSEDSGGGGGVGGNLARAVKKVQQKPKRGEVGGA